MKYLIVKCEGLNDQYECDADRIPMYITDNWKNNLPTDYYFDVYEIFDNGRINPNPIKCWDEPMETGMAFGYWKDKGNRKPEDFHWIKKFPNRSPEDKVPANILHKLKQLEEYNDLLERAGYITGYDPVKKCIFVYGEYKDENPPCL
jgi:hypothetical protein